MRLSKKIITILVAMLLVLPMAFAIVACKNNEFKGDNENTALILPIDNGSITGNFNPFTVDGANDRLILERLSMYLIWHDAKGAISYGKDEAVATLDMKSDVINQGQANESTVYTFVLKNNINFSDGSRITLKDVLFTLHVYLDPYCVTSNTLHSSPIKGLEDYRGRVEYVIDEDENSDTYGDIIDVIVTPGQATDIAGIRRVTEDVVIGDQTYTKATYNDSGDFTGDGYEAFSITLDGVDPKLPYNTEVSLVSYKQYGNKAGATFDWDTYQYGLKAKDRDWLTNNVLGSSSPKIPLSSGPYQAADKDYNPTNDYNKFKTGAVVNMVRNPEFFKNSESTVVHPATIKKLSYTEVNATELFNKIKKNEIHYGTASSITLGLLSDIAKDNDMQQLKANNWGYGYVGVSAKFIPEIDARRAIMMAMNTNLSVAAYPNGYASVTKRALVQDSWAYPDNPETYYGYIADNADGTVSQEEYQQVAESLNKAGYKVNGKGFNYNPNGKTLGSPGEDNELIFTIPTSENSPISGHPANAMLQRAAQILRDLGQFVKADGNNNGMQDLQAGGRLAVWAAAWTQDADPDMYQLYYLDEGVNNPATAITNWGFRDILNQTPGHTQEEKNLLKALAGNILAARQTTVQNDRIPLYHEALDQVMELAVELPTYQRNLLKFWKKSVLDSTTFSPGISGLRDSLYNIWNVSFAK